MKKINENERIIFTNVFFTFLIKGGSLVISLISTPLFLKYFDGDKVVLGVWYTLWAMLTWFTTFDLGIGNGIRNKLVNAFIKKDKNEIRKIISSGLFSNIIVTLVLTILGTSFLYNVNLNKILNISEDVVSSNVLRNSAIIVFYAIMLRFLLTVINSIFYSLQQSFKINIMALVSSILQLLFLVVFKFKNVEKALLYISIANLITANFPIIIAGMLLFYKELRFCRPSVKYVDKEHIKGIMGVGSSFFLCQIMYMLMMNTNEVIISNLFSPQYTTHYTFYFRITSLIATMLSLAMTPMWSVVTKAISERNYIWVNQLYKKLKILGLVFTFIQFLIIPFLQSIMDLWLRGNSIDVNYKTAFAFAMYGSIFIYVGILSTIVCGMTRMKLQMICYAIGMVVRFILIFIFAEVGKNWDSVVWSTVIVLLPYCIIQHIDLNFYFKRKISEKNSDNELSM